MSNSNKNWLKISFLISWIILFCLCIWLLFKNEKLEKTIVEELKSCNEALSTANLHVCEVKTYEIVKYKTLYKNEELKINILADSLANVALDSTEAERKLRATLSESWDSIK